MVELGWLPAFGGVALGAILPKPSTVRVIFRVARTTILLCGLQVGQSAGCRMALSASQRGMIALQGESEVVVIERFSVSIQPIVTGQTISPKGRNVTLHEASLPVTMTILTNSQIHL